MAIESIGKHRRTVHVETQPPVDPTTLQFWRDVGERALKTFIQVFAVAGVGLTTIADVSWLNALSTGGLAALVSILLALATVSLPATGNLVVDTVERAAKTFIATLTASLAVYTGLAEVPWGASLGLAAVTALVSIGTSLGTDQVTGTASLLVDKEANTLPPVAPR